jgi:hypothetical protein
MAQPEEDQMSNAPAPATNTGLQITNASGQVWDTHATYNGIPIGVGRYHARSGRPASLELEFTVQAPSTWVGGIGVLTPASKAALEAFLGESLESHFAHSPTHPRLQVQIDERVAAVHLEGRLLPYLTRIEVWADFMGEAVTWVRWEGWVHATDCFNGLLPLTVEGQLIPA